MIRRKKEKRGLLLCSLYSLFYGWANLVLRSFEYPSVFLESMVECYTESYADTFSILLILIVYFVEIAKLKVFLSVEHKSTASICMLFHTPFQVRSQRVKTLQISWHQLWTNISFLYKNNNKKLLISYARYLTNDCINILLLIV